MVGVGRDLRGLPRRRARGRRRGRRAARAGRGRLRRGHRGAGQRARDARAGAGGGHRAEAGGAGSAGRRPRHPLSRAHLGRSCSRGWASAVAARLRAGCPTGRVDQKRGDALELLDRLARVSRRGPAALPRRASRSPGPMPGTRSTAARRRAEPTDVLDELRLRGRLPCRPSGPQALLRLLARREAERSGMAADRAPWPRRASDCARRLGLWRRADLDRMARGGCDLDCGGICGTGRGRGGDGRLLRRAARRCAGAGDAGRAARDGRLRRRWRSARGTRRGRSRPPASMAFRRAQAGVDLAPFLARLAERGGRRRRRTRRPGRSRLGFADRAAPGARGSCASCSFVRMMPATRAGPRSALRTLSPPARIEQSGSRWREGGSPLGRTRRHTVSGVPAAAGRATYREPITVELSPPAGSLGVGPHDDRMCVIEPVGKDRILRRAGAAGCRRAGRRCRLGAARGADPARPGPTAASTISSRTTRPSPRRTPIACVGLTLDVWEDYLGRAVPWHFAARSWLEIGLLGETYDNGEVGLGLARARLGPRPDRAAARLRTAIST